MNSYYDMEGKQIKAGMHIKQIKYNDIVNVVESNNDLCIEWCDHLFSLSDISVRSDWKIVKNTTPLSPYRYK